jgi:hypothetical protein
MRLQLKVKVTLEQAQKGSRCIALHFLQPRRQMGVVVQLHAPSALLSGKNRYTFCRKLGGTQSRSGRVRKLSPLQGFDPRTAQAVAIRYTD